MATGSILCQEETHSSHHLIIQLKLCSREEELQEVIKRKQRKTRTMISGNRWYFLGGCICGLNESVGRLHGSPAHPLPPTVLRLLSARTPRHSPEPWWLSVPPTTAAPHWALSVLWLPSLWAPRFPSCLLITAPLPSECHHPPRCHHSSQHVHPSTLPSDCTHCHSVNTSVSNVVSSLDSLPKGLRLAFPPLGMASPKREGKSQGKHRRKVDKGRTERRSLVIGRRASLWSGARSHIRKLGVVHPARKKHLSFWHTCPSPPSYSRSSLTQHLSYSPICFPVFTIALPMFCPFPEARASPRCSCLLRISIFNDWMKSVDHTEALHLL